MVVGGRELIDTLWNVNITVEYGGNGCVVELIDTLWNVNADFFLLTYLFLFVN